MVSTHTQSTASGTHLDALNGVAAPVRKQLIVLANSFKKGGGWCRCIAGLEVVDEIEGDLVIDDWIRPVSGSVINEGALSARHFTYADGTQVAPLDVVECRVSRAVGNEAQPENWLLDEETVWARKGKVSLSGLSSLVEEPGNLWCQPGVKTDRIAPDYLPKHPLRQSLVLIGIPHGQLRMNDKGRFRLAFTYQRVHYDLAVTDPRITPALVDRHGCLVKDVIACISLTQPYSGDYQPTPYHYKLVASLFLPCCS